MLRKQIIYSIVCFAIFTMLAPLSADPLTDKITNVNTLIYYEKYEEALKICNAMLAENPNDLNGLFLRGDTYYAMGEYRHAIEDYSNLLALRPEDPYSYAHRARAYFAMNEFDKCIENYKKAVSMKPNEDEFWRLFMNSLWALMDSANWDENSFSATYALETIDACTKALEYFHEDSDVYTTFLMRGFAYNSIWKLDLAIADFSRAIDLDSGSIKPFYLRGHTFFKLEDYQSALKDFTKVIEFDSQYLAGYFFRGCVYSELKNYKQAMLDFKQIQRLDPSAVLGYVGSAKIYLSTGQYKNSLEDYNTALKLNSKDSEVYVMRAFVYYMLEDKKRSDADIETALLISSNDVKTKFAVVGFYIDTKQWEKCIELASELIKMKLELPNLVKVLAQRGEAYYENRDYELAEKDLTMLIELKLDENDIRYKRNLAKAFYMRSQIFIKQGKEEESKVDLQKAAQLDPNYSKVEEEGVIGKVNLKYSPIYFAIIPLMILSIAFYKYYVSARSRK